MPLPKHKVTLEVNKTDGDLMVDPAVDSDSKAEEGTVLTFTAKPKDNKEVDKWEIKGGSFESGTGADGATEAKVKVTGPITVKVTFKDKKKG